MTKLKKLKLWHNSKTQNVTKLKTQIVKKLKLWRNLNHANPDIVIGEIMEGWKFLKLEEKKHKQAAIDKNILLKVAIQNI